tara:strand:- start:361 stop:1026 length:666 start_codon:yes stop_codon:yes gene_type:complete
VTPEPFNKYDLGGAYHWKWYLVNYDDYRDFSNSLVDLMTAPGRLLDVGCGDGLISYLYFRSGFDVVGLDTSNTAIQLSKFVCNLALQKSMGSAISSVKNTHFTAGDRDKLIERFESGGLQFFNQSIYELSEINKFDYAICSEVIEHVEYPERLLENVNRAIRKFAIITTPNGLQSDGSIDEPGKYDFHSWSPATFAQLLDGYNFEFLDLRPGTISIKLNKS